MPSSTSNSSPHFRTPAKRWGLVIAGTLAVAFAILAGVESWLRANGHRPSVTESEDLWAYHMGRLASADETAVAAIGASPVLMGLSPEVFHKRHPDRELIILARGGMHPFATLEYVAQSTDFNGILLIGMDPDAFAPGFAEDQRPLIEHYEESLPWNRLTAYAGARIQEPFALLNAQSRFSRILRGLMSGNGLKPSHVSRKANRSIHGDFRLTDREKLRAGEEHTRVVWGAKSSLPAEVWRGYTVPYAEQVAAIQARGGTVVFVHFPMTGVQWEVREQRYPKSEFWDRLAEATGAQTIHFKDHESLDGFDCPDWIHLDVQDVPVFTEGLLDVLASQGVLD